MFLRLDAAILARIERFCHWFQRLTGLTNFWCARIALLLVAVDQVMHVINWHHQILESPGDFIGATSSVVVFIAVLAMIPWSHKAEQRALASTDTRPAWRLVLEFPFLMILRSFLLCLNVFVTQLSILYVAMFVRGLIVHPLPCDISVMMIHSTVQYGMPLLFFFLAIDPLPPGTSKVREFLESLRPQPQLQPAPARR